MSSSNFNLPEDLNVKDFWSLPMSDWKNITKYDFRYLVGSLEISKEKAHLAYSDDIKKLQKNVKKNSNKWQVLEACKAGLQNAQKNHANRFFWENEAKRVVEIASSGLAVDEELLQLEKVTAITALKSFNNMENAKREESERKKEKRKATTQNEQASCKKQDSKPEKPTFKQLFESFQRQALFQASVNDGLCMETHMYELLSLQDIILLKQSQYSPSVRNHFGEELLQTLYDELRTSLYDKTKKFGEEISLVQDIIYNYIQEVTDKTKKNGSKMNCARKLIALTANRPEAEANILFGIAALIQKLPVRTMIEGTVQGEAELWSGIFDPILSSILSDPENDVLLRWSNVLPTEASSSSSNQVRPDAMVCEIDQLSWGKSLGFGEVKLADVTPNLNELGHDLLRLATLSKSALSKSGLHASMSFQIHGYRIKIYMSKLIPGTGITAMLEVLSLEFPKSVHQLDAFTTRRNFDNLVHLYDMFWNNCLSQQKAETVTTSNVLELSTLNAIRQSTRDRTRLNHLQY